MRAVAYDAFGAPPRVTELDDVVPPPHGAVLRVVASGVCRSDWHGWSGHDPDVVLPHVPGHELAGTVAAGVGADVRGWSVGSGSRSRSCAPAAPAPRAARAPGQVCLRQTQPGFTHWGSFARAGRPSTPADVNLIALPDEPAVRHGCLPGLPLCDRLPCRHRGRAGLARGSGLPSSAAVGWGCPPSRSRSPSGPRVVAVDPSPGRRALAASMGAEHVLAPPASRGSPRPKLTGGGAHVALDCSGVAGDVRGRDPGAPPSWPARPGGSAAAPRRADPRSRWSWWSPGSWPCSAATASPPAPIRSCSRSTCRLSRSSPGS